jgi:hypothetical protein
MAGSGRFTFIFTEREASIIAEALETAADQRSDYFKTDDFRIMAHRIDDRLAW